MFICSECGYGSVKWIGRCPSCNQWNTMVNKPNIGNGSSSTKKRRFETKNFETISLSKIKTLDRTRIKTSLDEFNQVLGGGFAQGEVVLFTGQPGIGKSTLVLQILQNLRTVYVSGEESGEQIKHRAQRLKVSMNKIYFSNNLQIESIISGVKENGQKPQVLVIDSIQTVYSGGIDSPPGSINQLKEITSQLVRLAKENKIVVLIIGHITKGGNIAGPKTLEHFVDCVLNLEGEKLSQYRLLRSLKNRFGSLDNIGLFEMGAKGLKTVKNPLVFLEENNESKIGKAIVSSPEGKRPLFFEIQTLVVPTNLPMPRRIVKGLNYNKVLLLLAVINKFLHLPMYKFDVYVNVVGGVEIKSPAADLGLVASVLSSFKEKPLPKNSIFVSEVGLLGNTRKIFSQETIIKQAKKLGFKTIYSSANIKNIKQLRKILF